jgi:transcriptional regulator with XRE-family HTH domain
LDNSQSVEDSNWISNRMSEVGIKSLSELELKTGINRGTLSRYFRGVQRPSIDALPALCSALEVSPETLLRALGVDFGGSSK